MICSIAHILITIFISYNLGSIPFAYILTKIYNQKDIRNIGSGNIGATNTYRACGYKIALTTLILDILKTILAFFIIKTLFSKDNYLVYISVFSSFIGHVFPFWLGFKGGKGVAVAAGTMIIIAPIAAIFSFVVWVIVFFMTRISSLSALCTSVSTIIFTALYYGINTNVFITIFLMLTLIVTFHRSNIKKLINKEEKTI